MKLRDSVLLATLVVSVFYGTSAIAKGRHGEQQCHVGLLSASQQLNLTQEQQDQIRAIRQTMRSERQAQRKNRMEMKPFFEKRQAVMLAPTFDEAAAKALIAEMSTFHNEQMLKKMRLQQQMFNVLDSDQKELWRQLKADNQPCMSAHRGKNFS